ncbi:MAG TPA: hypothetical protein VNN21_06905 [Dehalococcoidia bacterium]|nr:hypothetical protein [Dehalococcoidia bacterium]
MDLALNQDWYEGLWDTGISALGLQQTLALSRGGSAELEPPSLQQGPDGIVWQECRRLRPLTPQRGLQTP